MNNRMKQMMELNPHNILTEKAEWVRWGYEHNMGDINTLSDFAKRYHLMHAVDLSEHVPHSVKKAFWYLLNIDGGTMTPETPTPSSTEEVKRFTDSEYAQSPWIHIAERQPEPLQFFIAAGYGWTVQAYRTSDGDYRVSPTNAPVEFPYWMPLPPMMPSQIEVARGWGDRKFNQKLRELHEKDRQYGSNGACRLPNEP